MGVLECYDMACEAVQAHGQLSLLWQEWQCSIPRGLQVIAAAAGQLPSGAVSTPGPWIDAIRADMRTGGPLLSHIQTMQAAYEQVSWGCRIVVLTQHSIILQCRVVYE